MYKCLVEGCHFRGTILWIQNHCCGHIPDLAPYRCIICSMASYQRVLALMRVNRPRHRKAVRELIKSGMECPLQCIRNDPYTTRPAEGIDYIKIQPKAEHATVHGVRTQDSASDDSGVEMSTMREIRQYKDKFEAIILEEPSSTSQQNLVDISKDGDDDKNKKKKMIRFQFMKCCF